MRKVRVEGEETSKRRNEGIRIGGRHIKPSRFHRDWSRGMDEPWAMRDAAGRALMADRWSLIAGLLRHGWTQMILDRSGE